MMQQYIRKIFLFMVAFLFATQGFSQVITMDGKDTSQQAELLYKEGKKAYESTKETIEKTKALATLGDIGFLTEGFSNYIQQALQNGISKPALSSEAVEAIPKVSNSDSTGITDKAKSVVPTSGSESNQKFENRTAVSQSISKNMQVNSDSSDSNSSSDIVSSVSSAITGEDSNAIKASDITKKRAQLSQSKQAFARYGLAVALVHRTLAYRTLVDTKQTTEQKAAETTNTRTTHNGKTTGNVMMAETYNRLLMSQGTANGLSGFSAMDEVEGKIEIFSKGLTYDVIVDGLSGISNSGGALGLTSSLGF